MSVSVSVLMRVSVIVSVLMRVSVSERVSVSVSVLGIHNNMVSTTIGYKEARVATRRK